MSTFARTFNSWLSPLLLSTALGSTAVAQQKIHTKLIIEDKQGNRIANTDVGSYAYMEEYTGRIVTDEHGEAVVECGPITGIAESKKEEVIVTNNGRDPAVYFTFSGEDQARLINISGQSKIIPGERLGKTIAFDLNETKGIYILQYADHKPIKLSVTEAFQQHQRPDLSSLEVQAVTAERAVSATASSNARTMDDDKFHLTFDQIDYYTTGLDTAIDASLSEHTIALPNNWRRTTTPMNLHFQNQFGADLVLGTDIYANGVLVEQDTTDPSGNNSFSLTFVADPQDYAHDEPQQIRIHYKEVAETNRDLLDADQADIIIDEVLPTTSLDFVVDTKRREFPVTISGQLMIGTHQAPDQYFSLTPTAGEVAIIPVDGTGAFNHTLIIPSDDQDNFATQTYTLDIRSKQENTTIRAKPYSETLTITSPQDLVKNVTLDTAQVYFTNITLQPNIDASGHVATATIGNITYEIALGSEEVQIPQHKLITDVFGNAIAQTLNITTRRESGACVLEDIVKDAGMVTDEALQVPLTFEQLSPITFQRLISSTVPLASLISDNGTIEHISGNDYMLSINVQPDANCDYPTQTINLTATPLECHELELTPVTVASSNEPYTITGTPIIHTNTLQFTLQDTQGNRIADREISLTDSELDTTYNITTDAQGQATLVYVRANDADCNAKAANLAVQVDLTGLYIDGFETGTVNLTLDSDIALTHELSPLEKFISVNYKEEGTGLDATDIDYKIFPVGKEEQAISLSSTASGNWTKFPVHIETGTLDYIIRTESNEATIDSETVPIRPVDDVALTLSHASNSNQIITIEQVPDYTINISGRVIPTDISNFVATGTTLKWETQFVKDSVILAGTDSYSISLRGDYDENGDFVAAPVTFTVYHKDEDGRLKYFPEYTEERTYNAAGDYTSENIRPTSNPTHQYKVVRVIDDNGKIIKNATVNIINNTDGSKYTGGFTDAEGIYVTDALPTKLNYHIDIGGVDKYFAMVGGFNDVVPNKIIYVDELTDPDTAKVILVNRVQELAATYDPVTQQSDSVELTVSQIQEMDQFIDIESAMGRPLLKYTSDYGASKATVDNILLTYAPKFGKQVEIVDTEFNITSDMRVNYDPYNNYYEGQLGANLSPGSNATNIEEVTLFDGQNAFIGSNTSSSSNTSTLLKEAFGRGGGFSAVTSRPSFMNNTATMPTDIDYAISNTLQKYHTLMYKYKETTENVDRLAESLPEY